MLYTTVIVPLEALHAHGCRMHMCFAGNTCCLGTNALYAYPREQAWFILLKHAASGGFCQIILIYELAVALLGKICFLSLELELEAF